MVCDLALVPAKVLAHPSRFSASVPLCVLCSFVFVVLCLATFDDSRRVLVFSPGHPPLLLPLIFSRLLRPSGCAVRRKASFQATTTVTASVPPGARRGFVSH